MVADSNMDQLKCDNCGAPLKLRPRDIKKGVATCQFCNSTFKFGGEQQVLDEDLKRSLKLLGTIKDMIGLETDDPDSPAEKPYDTKIELENTPGVRFFAKFPRYGLSLHNGFMAMFTLFWCTFMVVWNVIGIATGAFAMVAFGFLHDAVGVWLFITTMWNIFGREKLEADGQNLTRTKILFGKHFVRTYPLENIDDVVFKIASRQNGKIRRGLYLMVGTKKVRIGSNASLPELKWLRKELVEFFKSRW